jgi:hypothetical protein
MGVYAPWLGVGGTDGERSMQLRRVPLRIYVEGRLGDTCHVAQSYVHHNVQHRTTAGIDHAPALSMSYACVEAVGYLLRLALRRTKTVLISDGNASLHLEMKRTV